MKNYKFYVIITKFTYKNGDKEEILYKHFENRLLLCPKATLATLAENKAAIKVGEEVYLTKPIEIKKQPIVSEEGVYPKCKKKHIDIAKPEHWITQKPSQCWAACVEILRNYGIEGGFAINKIIVADQNENELISKNIKEGLKYIDLQLENGNPIVLGVDDTLRKETYNAHKATEHFIIIVGKGCEQDKIYYRFFDVARTQSKDGTSENNRLYLIEKGDGKFLQGNTYKSKHTQLLKSEKTNSKN